ncbi:histidine triad nucleotide-binding protein [Patescibacteria group bacterium]|nr:histidine triad nucleotide-binding protein [Patescibacteria group bacterium]
MDCVFCKIAKKEIPAKIVYEDNNVLAFEDIEPKTKVHILLIPKKHISSTADLKPEDKELIGDIFLSAVKIAREKGISETGFRIVINHGKDAGQTINHLHFHLLGGEKLPFA